MADTNLVTHPSRNLAMELTRVTEAAALAAGRWIGHGDKIAADVGIDPRSYEIDMDGMKASFGVDPSIEALTYADLQERREIIRSRFAKRSRKVGLGR